MIAMTLSMQFLKYTFLALLAIILILGLAFGGLAVIFSLLSLFTGDILSMIIALFIGLFTIFCGLVAADILTHF